MQFPLMQTKVQAGFPSPASDYVESKLDLNEYLIDNPPATFLVGVKGTSMEGAGILEDDIAIVDRSRTPKSGDIVVAVKDNEFLVKELMIVGHNLTLKAHHLSVPLQYLDENNGDLIWGVVTGIVRRIS